MTAVGIAVRPPTEAAPCPTCGAPIVDTYVGVRIDAPVAVTWQVCYWGHATEADAVRLALLDTDG